MSKGKILKVRIGHEANCSSGMIAMFMLLIGVAAYLPLSVIAAAVQAEAVAADRPRYRKSLLVFQLIGLGLTALLAYLAITSGYSVSGPLELALVIGGSFALSVTIGHFKAPDMQRPAWLVLVVPLVFVLGVVSYIGLVSSVGSCLPLPVIGFLLVTGWWISRVRTA